MCLSLFFSLLFSPPVSPELLGVLSSIAAFMALMALFFFYLSNKLSVKSSDDLSHLGGFKDGQQGSQRHGQVHRSGCMLLFLLWFDLRILMLFRSRNEKQSFLVLFY